MSEEKKGYRMRYDNIVNFFREMAKDTISSIPKISENDKAAKALEIKNKHGELQSQVK
jgi:hypothetical protein